MIRYRTGDQARILPGNCPCGGLIRHLDWVSRLGTGIDMENLDSALFRCPDLVDMKADWLDGILVIRARTLGGDGKERRES